MGDKKQNTMCLGQHVRYWDGMDLGTYMPEQDDEDEGDEAMILGCNTYNLASKKHIGMGYLVGAGRQRAHRRESWEMLCLSRISQRLQLERVWMRPSFQTLMIWQLCIREMLRRPWRLAKAKAKALLAPLTLAAPCGG